jgi:Protein of unknown function (DUF1573)
MLSLGGGVLLPSVPKPGKGTPVKFSTSLLICCLAAMTSARSELEWTNPSQEFIRAPEDQEITARFAFKNIGSSPITISRIATSCGCTTSKLEKRKYEAAETGAIEVRFVFGARRGEQRKIITVATDDGRQTALELRCWIEEYLQMKPALVFWRIGEQPDAKAIELTAANNHNIGVTSVKSSNPKVIATLETTQEGKHYIIRVRPMGTGEKESAQLTIYTNFPPDAPKNYTAYARVK